MATKTRIDMIRPFHMRSGIMNTEKVMNALSQSQCAVGTRLCINMNNLKKNLKWVPHFISLTLYHDEIKINMADTVGDGLVFD